MLHGESAVPSVPTPVPLTSFQKMIETQDYVLNLCEDRWLQKKKKHKNEQDNVRLTLIAG